MGGLAGLLLKAADDVVGTVSLLEGGIGGAEDLVAVLDAAETFDPERVVIEAEAFGEALPMACDDTDWGRRINRRVEVWVE